MERLKLKELEALKRQKEQRVRQQAEALQALIQSDQSMAITLNYARSQLQLGQLEGLSEYSPTFISRLVFEDQLREIKEELGRLPGSEAKIEHFMVVMLRVMKFPFEKCPHYLVGLKDMFYEMVEEGRDTISYLQIEKYILGELVTIKEEAQNTEFQVQMREHKKQDYLLHDNGIKRVRFCKDLRMVLSLDNRAHTVKIYDHEMKNVSRFSPKKEKHGNKFPFILDFDHSEIGGRLGVLLSDETICTVHLNNLLSKTQAEFDAGGLNEVVFPLPCPMKQIHYLQMINRWLAIPQQGLGVYLFDMERVRSQPEKVKSRPKLVSNDLPVSKVVEVVPLSCVCVVTGNEVNFYTESFSQLKYGKFSHHQQIQHLRYCDEKNQFYLCGREKAIHTFSIGRNGHPTGIRSLAINRSITDFEVFPHFDTIVIADEEHDIRLMHEQSRTVYQQLSYGHIVKNKDAVLQLSKMSKTELGVYQTYLLVLNQEKVAIERDIEYSFLPYWHFDQKKEELYLSVNHQIIGFSLTSGEIRRHYSADTAIVDNHHCFFLAPKTPLFILDKQQDMYEVYPKDLELEGENFSYRKRVGVEKVVGCFYDSEMRVCMVVGENSLSQVRNDGRNNFTTINSLLYEGFGRIAQATFCPRSKTVSYLTNEQIIWQSRNYTLGVERGLQLVFPPGGVQEEEGLIVQFNYDHHFDLLVILSNKSEIYLIELETEKQVYFKLEDNLPHKLKDLKFGRFDYQLVPRKNRGVEPYLLLRDATGFIVQFSLLDILAQNGITLKEEPMPPRQMFKDTHTISREDSQVRTIKLSQSNPLHLSYEQMGLMKAHEKAIALAMRVKVELDALLTVSIDGYIRLWNHKYDCLFSLKIPSLVKMAWNMKEIEGIKNRKSIEQVLDIFNQHLTLKDEAPSPVQVCNKSKRLRRQQQPPRVNHHDPIKLEIQNKDLEEIVMQRPNYSTDHGFGNKHRTQQQFHSTMKVYPHPWRNNKTFKNMFHKAPSPLKYNQKIPHELLQMRSSLDMTQKIKKAPDYSQAQQILPQLSFYQAQPKQVEVKNPESSIEDEEVEQFESCLYVKSGRRKKKVNDFDEIDKQFKKKEMLLTAMKWVPKKRKERKSSVVEVKADPLGWATERKVDPITAVTKIFEQHNRECMQTKKGRMIRIPKININRDFY